MIGWIASGSRPSSADPGDESEVSNPGEPITNAEPAVPGEASAPAPGAPRFGAYGIGEATPDSDPAVAYSQLGGAEQEVVDRGGGAAQAAQWSGVHDAYKQAVAARAAAAAAQAAAIQLGIAEGLAEGVVP